MKVSDLKEGDVFKEPRGGRTCTIEMYEPLGELVIRSLVDGWEGRAAHYKYMEVELVEMPKTVGELIKFIREYQIRYDARLEE